MRAYERTGTTESGLCLRGGRPKMQKRAFRGAVAALLCFLSSPVAPSRTPSPQRRRGHYDCCSDATPPTLAAAAFLVAPPRRSLAVLPVPPLRPSSAAVAVEPPPRRCVVMGARKSSRGSDDNDVEREGGAEEQKGARVRRGWGFGAAGRSVRRLVIGDGVFEDNAPNVGAVAGVLADAALEAASLTAGEVSDAVERRRRGGGFRKGRVGRVGLAEDRARVEGEAQQAIDAVSLAKTKVSDAFCAAEAALDAADAGLKKAREELNLARGDAASGLAAAERAAAAAARRARLATESAIPSPELAPSAVEADEAPPPLVQVLVETINEAATNGEDPSSPAAVTVMEELTWDDLDENTDLRYEDVDYTLTEMLPPFINEDECLVPGEPVVRVEKAPQNSRRIFAGIDIPVGVDDVWNLLTDYENLQKVVPNLVVNEVLQLYDPADIDSGDYGTYSLNDEEQCRAMAERMKGAVLKQVGGAKVVGINFSARTTLEVREWPDGMPDFKGFNEEVYAGKSRSQRAREGKTQPLKRYMFPRPFAVSSLPHKDISMQSVEKDDGEFRMYQGVWRMQPLVGCAPPGGKAMRLTYAVEVSPRPYLPVALVEGRIAQDLCNNLKAIREKFPAV